MKVTLVYPPNRNVPSSPYGALPLLAGSLTATGHAHGIVDVNLEVFERLLRPESIAWAEEQCLSVWNRLRAKPTLTPAEVGTLQAIAQQMVVPFARLYEAEQAGRVLRNWDLFRVPENVNRAYDTIACVLRALYTLNPVVYPSKSGAVGEMFDYLGADFLNPISRLVDEVAIDMVLAQNPDLVAVSIPFNEQLVEALAFLKALKRRAPELRTLVGGAIVTAYAPKLCADPRFFRYADLAMPGEADQSFHRLVTTLERGGDLGTVANLWWRDAGGRVRPPSRTDLPNLDETAAPDFSQVPIGRYFLPDTIVNYQTSRGCYYGKCTFCSYDIKKNFRHRKVELVQQDIERIQAQTGLRHFIFWDPLTPPNLMKGIARWNKDRGERMIYWGAETKFEKVFARRETMDLLYAGGARFLQFGFESGSQRVLDLMVKGNDMNLVPEVLTTLRDAGIAVSVQWFIGFPGETEAEANQSFAFLHRHRDSVLLSSYMGTFTLSPDDDIFQSAGELYDIKIFQHANGRFDYRHSDGTPHYDLEELNAAYMSRGDMESVTRMAFYLYLTDQPARAPEVANFRRGGLFPATWEEMAEGRPILPDWNFLARYDFDIFTPPREQGIADAGSPLPRRESSVLHVSPTQQIYPVSASDVAMLARADGSRTAAEIVAGAGGDPAALRARLLAFVRRGLLVVPLPASDDTESAVA
ncbi:MAG: radical SAM protein [Planctomycetota bacterium]